MSIRPVETCRFVSTRQVVILVGYDEESNQDTSTLRKHINVIFTIGEAAALKAATGIDGLQRPFVYIKLLSCLYCDVLYCKLKKTRDLSFIDQDIYFLEDTKGHSRISN